MLQDSARIQAADARYLNHKLADDPSWEPLSPLYDEADVTLALKSFRPVPYHKLFHPLPGVTAHFLNAGHILGSAQVVLDVDHQGTKRRVVISGDLGRQGLPIIRDPERPPAPIDYLVMESTYGNRVHGSLTEMEGDLERIVNDSVRRRGKIIVPAFAVGRTQELLFVLHGLLRSKRIPSLPIFIDSPLAIDVTETFRRHRECFDQQTQEFLRLHGDVFSFEGVRFTRTAEESMQINRYEGPAIIISASGMAEGGRVLHHLRNHVSNENSTILIIGYMAQQTLGRRLVERRSRVKIWGVERELVARVEVLDSFSAHADRNDLVRYATGCGPLRELFLVHGEPDQQEPLKTVLSEQGITCRIPRRSEVIELH
jgi:metallo-beta-lactamase family protein